MNAYEHAYQSLRAVTRDVALHDTDKRLAEAAERWLDDGLHSSLTVAVDLSHGSTYGDQLQRAAAVYWLEGEA